MSTAVFQEYKFIGHLERLVKEQERGALAALRRGLGKPPGTAREMDRHVLPYVPSESGLPTSVREKQENAYYLVGALFAFWYQGKIDLAGNPPKNLGASLHALVEQEVKNGAERDKAEDRTEKRLVALLNCHRDDLPDHLRHVISLLKAKDVPIDWPQLLNDVQNWQRESRDVQRAWARWFWREIRTKENETGNSEHQPENEGKKEE